MNKKKVRRKMRREYFKTVLPAFFGAFGMALYYFTDGLFIGNAVGDDGMSAITCSWNVVILLTAVASGLGTGAGIRLSVALGENDKEAAAGIVKDLCMLCAAASAVLMLGLWILEVPVLRLFGAEGNVLTLSRAYIRSIVWGVPVQIFALALLPVVRALGGEKTAGAAMSAGYLVNFFLDIVLMVWIPLGMFGCGVAYISGQAVVAIPCLVACFRRYKKQLSGYASGRRKRWGRKILATGVAPFGLYFSQVLVTACISRGFMRHGGSEALACYTVVVYIAGIVNTLHRAIMEGSQPLISRCHGQGDLQKANQAGLWMYVFSLVLIVTGAVATLCLKTQVAGLFGVSDQVTNQVAVHLPGYLLGYLCISFSRTAISHLSAIDAGYRASVLTYMEPVTMMASVMILPRLWGMEGMWLAVILAYMLMALLAVGILWKTLRRK